MAYADYHIHTHLSFDSDADLHDVCRAGVAAGLSAIAITNHFDFDGILDGIYPPYFPHHDRAEIEAARTAFPNLKILFGIELGQVHTYSRLLPALKAAHGFDYLLASVHNLENTPDFAFLRYEMMTDAHCINLLSRYFKEVRAAACVPGIHALAHLTYPIRYMTRTGKKIDLLRFETELRDLFRVLVENGVALEINTSGLRQGMGQPLPDFSLAALYRDCGGRAVVVGSDAHEAANVGAGVIETTDRLRSLGLKTALL